MYGSTLLNKLTEALLILTKAPLWSCLSLKIRRILTDLGLSLLTPLILTTKANLGSAGTKICPLNLACLLAVISACWEAWYWASYCWALWVIYCLLVLLEALLCSLCCWRAVAIFWSLYYFFLSPSGLGATCFYPAIYHKIKLIIKN